MINSPPEYEMPLFIFVVVFLLAFGVIVGFAKGQNWARIIIIMSSILSIPAPFISSEYGISGIIIAIMEAITGIYLLYWLNTKDVKAYFKKIEIKIKLKEFFLPNLNDEISSKKLINLCAIYFCSIATLYFTFALTHFGTWSLTSSDTYARIIESLLVGLSLYKCWKTIVIIFLTLQVGLLTFIFISGMGLKLINTMSLLVLIYGYFAVKQYHEHKST